MKKLILFILLSVLLIFSFNAYWEEANEPETEEEIIENYDDWINYIDQPSFMVPVTGIFWWEDKTKKTAEETINFNLATFIQKLLIWLWIIASLIMTIWAWFMIIYHWQDELLTRWKNIFMAWITSLVVALISYQIVALIRYIIYS